MSDNLDPDRTIGEQWSEVYVRSVRAAYAAELREAGQRGRAVAGPSTHDPAWWVLAPGPGEWIVIPADALAGEDEK